MEVTVGSLRQIDFQVRLGDLTQSRCVFNENGHLNMKTSERYDRRTDCWRTKMRSDLHSAVLKGTWKSKIPAVSWKTDFPVYTAIVDYVR